MDNISTESGKVEMFFTGEKPWHGLGKELAEPATAAEAIAAAGLGWTVETEEIYLKNGVRGGDKFQAIVRQDTRRVLGTATDRYQPIQNVEAFGFFDEVVGKGQAIYHTAGALGRGERIWILAKLPDYLRIDGTDDITEKFLLLANSHDGGSSLKAFYTPIRVVCQNTLYAALRDAKDGISIRHTGNILNKVNEAQLVLGLAVKYYDTLSEIYNVLAKKSVNQAQVQAYLKELVPDPKEGNASRAENIRHKIDGLFQYGKGNNIPGIRGTAWALLNGVSEYVTHNRTVRVLDADGLSKGEATGTSRLNTLWFGTGRQMNAEAFDLALDLAGIGDGDSELVKVR
jgi:phage/plasmid-like protein (TIGR03299 family)